MQSELAWSTLFTRQGSDQKLVEQAANIITDVIIRELGTGR